jgi:mono/diheme cytochrome c family protein
MRVRFILVLIMATGVLAGVTGCVGNGTPAYSAHAASQATTRTDKSGRELFQDNCAACHNADGKGRSKEQVGFDYPLPDFTDCSFNSAEQSADWVAIAHQGGPIRGFSQIMPSFGDALTVSELNKLIEYVRGFCADPRWPRGELNFPLAMFTEKAFPENETLLKSVIDKDGSSETKLIYERRIGARSQYELVLPYSHIRTGEPEQWQHGFGDVAVAFKQVLGFNLDKGFIFSAVAELGLPTGNELQGLGAGHATLETFLAYGQRLPKDFFLHSRAIYAAPLDGSAREAGLEVALGRMMTQGPFGRQWNPIVEFLGSRELASGASTVWDWAPQVQVSLNQRQHILLSVGARLPLTERTGRDGQIAVTLLWDWFDGGLLDGWQSAPR